MTRVLCCLVVLAGLASVAVSQGIAVGPPVIALGGKCFQTSQCLIPGAVCENGFCACDVKTSHEVNGTSCARLVESSCNNHTDCVGIWNAQCIEGTCRCPETHVPNDNKTRCLSKVQTYGAQCEVNAQCITFGDEIGCRNGTCKCEQEYFYNGVQCLYKKGLGEQCDQPEFGCYLEETGDYRNVTCQQGKCVCAAGFLASINNRNCLKKAKFYYDSCEEQEQCSTFGTGGSCKQYKCVCEIEYFFNGSKCLYKKGLGEECNTSEFGCYLEADGDHQHVVCVNGQCACAKEFVANKNNTKCLTQMPAYNSSCSDQSECTRLGTGGSCKFNRCTCETEYFYNGTRCLYKKRLDEACNNPEFGCFLQDGGISKVACTGGKCVCAVGHTANKDKTKCEKDAPGAAAQLVVSLLCLLATVFSCSVL